MHANKYIMCTEILNSMIQVTLEKSPFINNETNSNKRI